MLTFLETQGARRNVLQLAVWANCSYREQVLAPNLFQLAPHEIFDEQGSI